MLKTSDFTIKCKQSAKFILQIAVTIIMWSHAQFDWNVKNFFPKQLWVAVKFEKTDMFHGRHSSSFRNSSTAEDILSDVKAGFSSLMSGKMLTRPNGTYVNVAVCIFTFRFSQFTIEDTEMSFFIALQHQLNHVLRLDETDRKLVHKKSISLFELWGGHRLTWSTETQLASRRLSISKWWR